MLRRFKLRVANDLDRLVGRPAICASERGEWPGIMPNRRGHIYKSHVRASAFPGDVGRSATFPTNQFVHVLIWHGLLVGRELTRSSL
jgi:hypothetical protein